MILRPKGVDVWRILDRVCDPELDEPITEMGFVDTVEITGSAVEVAFRLPTYWCSPNFAWLMAEGIRREVSALPWVSGVAVRLQDHMFADEVNAGVNAGQAFSERFAELSRRRGPRGAPREVRGEGVPAPAGERAAAAAVAGLRRRRHRRDDGATARRRRLRGRRGGGAEAALSRVAGEARAGALAGRSRLPNGGRRAADRRGAERLSGDAAPGADQHGVQRRALPRAKGTRYKQMELVEGEPTLVDFILGRVPQAARI